MQRTFYTLKSTPGPADSRLVAGTVDMAQKWPEVVSPWPVGTEVPGSPRLPSSHCFIYFFLQQIFFLGAKGRLLVPTLPPPCLLSLSSPPPPSPTHRLSFPGQVLLAALWLI